MNNNLIKGGPPIPCCSNKGQTGCNSTLFNNVQNTINCVCGTTGSLCSAMKAGELISAEPFSCMIDLIQNYSDCESNITPEQKKKAYDVFTEISGIKNLDMVNVLNNLNSQNINIVTYSSFYIFIPIIILLIIFIWIIVIFDWITWMSGLFCTVFIFAFLYSANILYRNGTNSYLASQNNYLVEQAQISQESYENGIALIPQSLFAVACAVTCKKENCWKCNNLKDKTINNTNIVNKCGC